MLQDSHSSTNPKENLPSVTSRDLNREDRQTQVRAHSRGQGLMGDWGGGGEEADWSSSGVIRS